MANGRMRLAFAALLLACSAVQASTTDETAMRRTLFFSGVDISSVSAFSWAGVEVSLHPSRDVSGPFIRLSGGTGQYDYESEFAVDGRIHGTVTLGDALAGWRHIGSGLSVAALAGVEIENHLLDEIDPENQVAGTGVGTRLMAELFWQPSATTWVEASVAYGTAFDFYRARLAGLNVWRDVFVGPEAEAFGNLESEQQRLGLFRRRQSHPSSGDEGFGRGAA